MAIPQKKITAANIFQWLWKWIRQLCEWFIVGLIYLCGVSSIIFVFSIFYFVFREGAPFLRDCFDFKNFFLSPEWYPTSISNKRYGILALLAGTGSVTIVAMLVAVPFSLGTAIFIAEFCKKKTKEAMKIVVEILAAIPSVVWGFIGLMVTNPLIVKLTGAPIGLNALNAGIIVGLMSVPIIVSIAEDSIRAVPDGYIEAAEALGATRWQTVYRVILPAAKNGLLAAVLLGVGRAVGETMAVLMATGHSVNIPFNGEFPYFHALESVRTLTATIVAEMGEAPRLDAGMNGSFPAEARHYQVLFVIGIVLFVITFVINTIADLAVKGIRQKKV
ncbi:MAG: phosphate ABC transporter permease subunit PstC [Kiritimatiellae bacterium]|nr:phosphate ABC transporter permease subunit PstC [Kiritimatiellia bacterium]MDD5521638.1 phosphate ABC transporter permease subunit PstC [Kiritimatiellia bacterium]